MTTVSLNHARTPRRVPVGRQCACRRGLTLIELMITISIIAILATIFLGALFTAQEQAKVMSTRSMIVKLNNLIMPRYEAYRTRRVPINSIATINVQTVSTKLGYDPASLTPTQIAAVQKEIQAESQQQRLNGLYELMRFEMPEAWTDVTDTPVLVNRPALSQAYLNAYAAVNGSVAYNSAYAVNQNAETLYLIVTLGFVDELGGRDLFNESNIGDTDGDGFLEFLDAWKNPIRFLRWAPGFTNSELNGAGGSLASGSNTTLTIQDVVANPPTTTYSYGMSKVNNAYAGKQITIYSISGKVMQSATIATSTYSASAGLTTLNLSPSTTFATALAAGDYFGIDADPFNPFNLDANQNPTSSPNTTHVSFAIYPLIYSAGPDKVYSIVSETGLTNGGAAPPTAFSTVDPFWSIGDSTDYTSGPVGWTADVSGENATSGWSSNMNGWLDNIHNHMIGNR